MPLPNPTRRKGINTIGAVLIGIAVLIISGVGFVLWLGECCIDTEPVQYFASQGIKIWVNATDPRGISWGAAAVRNTFDNSEAINGILVNNVTVPLDNWYVERNRTALFNGNLTNPYGTFPDNFESYFNYTTNDAHGVLKGTILSGGKTSGTCKVSTGNVIEIDEDGTGPNPPICLQKQNKPVTLQSGEKFIVYFRLPNGLIKPADAGNTAIVTIHGDKAEETTNVIISNPSGRFDAFGRPEVIIDKPGDGALFNTTSVAVTSTASDKTGVSQVSWKVDNGAVSYLEKLHRFPTPAISWLFDTGALTNGRHIIYVNATNTGGIVTTNEVDILVDTTDSKMQETYDGRIWYK